MGRFPGDRPAGRQCLAAARLGLLRARGGAPLRARRRFLAGRSRSRTGSRRGPALPADDALGDLERGEHRQLRRQSRTEALRGADPDCRPGDPSRSPRLEGDRRRPLRPAAADPPQRRLRRLPRAPVPRPAREAVLRRRRPAPLRRRRAGDGDAADQPAADHAPPRRRRHAAVRDRAGLGIGERSDPLAARSLGTGEPAFQGLRDALRQPGPLGRARRLVVHLDRRGRQLRLLPFGRVADLQTRSEARLVPLQRMDRGGRRDGAEDRQRRSRTGRRSRSAAAERNRQPGIVRLRSDFKTSKGAVSMAFSVPDLPYAYDALEPHIDEETMRIHHDKHHQAYVDKANGALEGTEWADRDVDEVLQNLSSLPDDKQGPVRNNAGGHSNHSFFWQIMGPDGGGEPSGDLAAAIDEKFGSFDSFKEEFKNAGVNRFGSGWAWLVHDGSGVAVTSTANQDSPISDGQTPLLGVDVWEHAYYLKYQNKRPDYLDAFWNVVNWDEVARRFDEAS